MLYYKLIDGTNIVGVGTSLDMLCFQRKHSILLGCDVSAAQYISYNGKLYRAIWMAPETDHQECILLDIIEIDYTEYDALRKALEVDQEITVETPSDTQPEAGLPSDATVEYVRDMKIVEMSIACNSAIESGFDTILSDGNVYHFSLTTQDQINLLSLSTLIANGMTSIPYHADGALCTYYSVQDMMQIITTATQYKTYHTSYFNSLRNWINAMTEISEIYGVIYGVTVPEEYCSVVLSELNKVLRVSE